MSAKRGFSNFQASIAFTILHESQLTSRSVEINCERVTSPDAAKTLSERKRELNIKKIPIKKRYEENFMKDYEGW